MRIALSKTGKLLTALLLTCCAAPAALGNDDPVRREFEGIYQRMAEALSSRDFHQVEDHLINLLTPTFTMKTLEGNTLDLKQEVENIKSNLKDIQSNEVEFEIACVSASKGNASVTLFWKNSGTVQGRDGRSDRIDQGILARDDWTRSGEGWRLTHTELLRQSYLFVNGENKTQVQRKH